MLGKIILLTSLQRNRECDNVWSSLMRTTVKYSILLISRWSTETGSQNGEDQNRDGTSPCHENEYPSAIAY